MIVTDCYLSSREKYYERWLLTSSNGTKYIILCCHKEVRIIISSRIYCTFFSCSVSTIPYEDGKDLELDSKIKEQAKKHSFLYVFGNDVGV